MATIQRIEDLDIWQKARSLARDIYQISNQNELSKDFPLRDQIRRAAISIMSNIAEGFERNGNKEFVQFLSIAKGSTGEVRSHLYIALDQNYINSNEFNRINNLLTELGRMTGGMINYLSKTKIKGLKYR
jgi:four helix bundle protein